MESALQSDLLSYIDRTFAEGDRHIAVTLLRSARTHDGAAATPRLQRCALVASRGSLDGLRHYVKLISLDFRDVISAAEYDEKDGELVHTRDLTKPLR
jgi:hypothetical protein